MTGSEWIKLIILFKLKLKIVKHDMNNSTQVNRVIYECMFVVYVAETGWNKHFHVNIHQVEVKVKIK